MYQYIQSHNNTVSIRHGKWTENFIALLDSYWNFLLPLHMECKNRGEGLEMQCPEIWHRKVLLCLQLSPLGSPLCLSCIHTPCSRQGLCGIMPHGVVWWRSFWKPIYEAACALTLQTCCKNRFLLSPSPAQAFTLYVQFCWYIKKRRWLTNNT